MSRINTQLNYHQSQTECRDKLVDLCTKWEMSDPFESTIPFEIDDNFMSTIYSVVHLLSEPDMRKKTKEYLSELDAEYDRCNNAIEETLSSLPDEAAKEVYMSSADFISKKTRMVALTEVKEDLMGRLNEKI